MEIDRICVVGAGMMGHGIAQLAATAGYSVALQDSEERFLGRAQERMQASLARMAKTGKVREEEVPGILARIGTTTDLEAAAKGADLVIEAVTELLEVKQEVFRRLDTLCRPHVILTTNTSQLSITTIAAVTNRPDKVVGMHFFNPPQVMKLIEIARGLETSDGTVRVVQEVSTRLAKESVVCKDSPGFITSRAICAFLLECTRILEEGVASKEDIDKAIRLAFNHPMGPFQLADLTGHDVNLHCFDALCDAFGDRFRAPLTTRQFVAAGRLGRKTGKGYYEYSDK